MLDIFSIDFEAKITKCILEKNETENIVTLDVSFYDISDFDKELIEDIEFQKYYFLKSELVSNKVKKEDKFSFKKEENILATKDEKIEFEVIDNQQVRVIKKQFTYKFKEDFLELQYSFGLNLEQIKLDFSFLKDQLPSSDKITKKTISILENGIPKEFVQDFRNLSFQKSPLNVREKYNKITVDTLFDKKIDLSEKLGKKNSFISQVYTAYGMEQRGEFDKTNVYLYFYIDSEEFVDNFCKYPKLVENTSEELKKSLSISATINESSETRLCELEECGLGSKYIYYRVKFESEHVLDKKIILKFFGIDFSSTKAKEVFQNLSEVIRSLKEERWVNAKFYVNKIPVVLNDSKKQILEIISTERRDIINQLIMNLQQIFSNYSTILDGSTQSENVSATNQPAYSSNNIISFQKEVLIKKEKESYVNIGYASGIRDGVLSFSKLKNTLNERLKKYYDTSLTSIEASKEKTIPLENTKYSYLNFDVENLDKYFSVLGEKLKDSYSVLFGLLQERKLEDQSQTKDALLSNGIVLQEEFVLTINNMSQAAASLDFIFGTQKAQETKKVALGNFDDTLDYSKIQNTMKSLIVLELLEEINKRDCELEYYNLKIDTFTDLKFALLDFATSLAGDSYLDRLPNSTKCLFGMFGKDNQKIKMDSELFKDKLVSFEKFFEFFLRYQFVFEIKYLQVGTNTNITQWKRLTTDRVNSILENEKLLCKLEVFEDDNIVSTKLLSKLHYSLRDEYFMMGK